MGQTLKAGDVIGLLGTTGNSTGAHLHTEIRLHDEDGSYRRDTPMAAGRVDPETWCCLHGLRL
jgi:murein DD-endopeptidase MepM/ murein hydrolase activator NlpD